MRRFAVVRILALVLAACLAAAWATPARAASVQARFTDAWRQFHNLVKDDKRGQYRSHWQDLEKLFEDVYKADPRGSLAPKALYYAARTNEELGLRSYLKSDFQRAVDIYHRAADRFPGHSWSDDCLYRAAELLAEKLNSPDTARQDLNRVLREYPRGDMYAKAVGLHRSLAGAEPEPEQRAAAPEPEPEPEPEPAQPAPRRTGGRTQLTAIRYQSSDEYTRVVLDVDEEVPYRYQILDPLPDKDKPYRLYIDLETAQLDPRVPHEVNIADGILRRVRAGQFDPNTARVVLDFQALQKYQIFALENPFRLVIDISAPDAAAKRAASKQTPAKPSRKTAQADPPTRYRPPPGSKAQVGDLIEQLGLTVETIMIDPGHGGKDPGAKSGSLYEKDINLNFARILGDALVKRGFKVLYTRNRDVFIPLEERTAMANVRKADLFVSIHCNAHKDSSINGFETYYLDLARSKDAVRVAARENAVSAKRISDLQFILTDLMLNSKMKESKDLATSVHDVTLEDMRKHYKLTDHGVRTAPFYVLMGAKMPSILVELGYITNRAERRRLTSSTYLQRKADALADGIEAYKKQIERFASL